MKKILLTTALILALTAPYANAAETNYVMKYENLDVNSYISWITVAVDKSTGKAIPLSGCDYFGHIYSRDPYKESGLIAHAYAYVPEGTEIVFEKRDYIHFNDFEYNYYGLDEVGDFTRRGVISGDENGNFNGDEILTRAQMTAILARLISADGEAVGDMPFTDVPKDAWFAPSVYALYSRGIVAGDELFNPDRLVTNEEFVAMEYRIIKALGAKINDNADITETDIEYTDFDSVSEYAKLPYSAMAFSYHVPYDFLWTAYIGDDGEVHTPPTDKRLLNPQKTITRSLAVRYLHQCFLKDFIKENEDYEARHSLDELTQKE